MAKLLSIIYISTFIWSVIAIMANGTNISLMLEVVGERNIPYTIAFIMGLIFIS
jgi:hypothetical protein